jgi:SAM-dependent methyltransferase
MKTEVEKSQEVKPINSQKVDKQAILESFVAANEHRDYSIYTRSMDAALEAKARSLFPLFGDLPPHAVIVDAGSGTGQLAELAARTFRGAQVYALDISHELLNLAESSKSLIHPIYGNAVEQNFPDNSVHIKFFSTSGHEIESFGGEDAMKKAVQIAYREAVPGWLVFDRDFVKPSHEEPILMEICTDVGLKDIPPGTQPEDIDYSLLSAWALFHRFHQEFRGGNAFDFEVVERQGRTFIKIKPEWAYEFYMRKDYTANWRQEIKEKYSYWTPEQSKTIFENAGFEDVEVILEYSDYIMNNRLKGKIALYDELDGQLVPYDFPPTHMVVRGRKPLDRDSAASPVEVPTLDEEYKNALASIHIDREAKKVAIDDKDFAIADIGITGTKKHVFHLAGDDRLILKVVRDDTLNTHNVFRSMYQIIERQGVLDEYQTPHLQILEHDQTSTACRYLIQQDVPEGSRCAASLIQSGSLTEDDIRQMAEIVNKYEKNKEWQLDTNPFSWYRVTNEDQTTQMVYVSNKVYPYDENWQFSAVGLLQWLDPKYVNQAQNYSAVIPTAHEYEQLKQKWSTGDASVQLWKRYLQVEV